MTRRHLLALGLLAACAGSGRTRVVTPYRGIPGAPVRVEVVNATGSELPMPPVGLVEQAVRVVAGRPDPEPSIPAAFARSAAAALAARAFAVAAADPAAARLTIRLIGWQPRAAVAAGGAVFVSADYELVTPGGDVIWRVEQRHTAVRLGAPNLSRQEVRRVVDLCVERAFASLPHAPAAGGAPAASPG